MIPLLGLAHASPASLDIELFRPSAGRTEVPGVPSAGGEPGDLAATVLLHYTHDPLIMIERADLVAAVVRDRLTMDVTGAWQVRPWLGLELGMPVIGDFTTQLSEEAALGFGAGDLRVGALLGPVRGSVGRLAVRLDSAWPVGTRDAWRGESFPRALPSVVGSARLGRLHAAADVGFVLRSPVDTLRGLEVGQELVFDAGAGLDAWPDRVWFTAGTALRRGLGPDTGWGNFGAELLLGASVHPAPDVVVSGVLGKGLTVGYGAPDFRFGVAFALVRPVPVKKEVSPAVMVIEEAPPPAVVVDLPDPPPSEPARLEADQIVLRDPIQFELGTARLLPESLPVLREVARVMSAHPELLLIVIEGHASEEGSFEYNYALSLARADAVYRELVLAGVHPDRLAARSVGEVQSVGLGQDEAALARDRRVVFRVARRQAPNEPLPPWATEIIVPWTGETKPMEVPAAPLPPPPPPETDPDTFEEEE